MSSTADRPSRGRHVKLAQQGESWFADNTADGRAIRSIRMVTATLLLAAWALMSSEPVPAFENYARCSNCHGMFRVGPYESRHDGSDWGDDLMDGHRSFIEGRRCTACHMTEGPGAVRTNASGDPEFSKGCVGCHGRDEDVTGICTGEASSPANEVECGSGAGLRRVHETALGVGTCSECHGADPSPVGEQSLPHNYALTASRVSDACNADGSESRFGPTGLDNDGDGRRDAEDADCGFRITAALNDAWFNEETPGQGFFVSVLPENGVVFLAWFTYDTERPPESTTAILAGAGHRWRTAFGPYAGDRALLDIEVTTGGIFDSRFPEPGQSLDGTIELVFSGCNSGELSYDIPSIERSGTMNIKRIVPDNVAACQAAVGAGAE